MSTTAKRLLTPASLPIPEGRQNNFWYIRNASDVVIVFLHGIFSQSSTCWLFEHEDPDKSVFWPDLIRNDRRLGAPSIYLAGYYTSIDGGDFSLAQCAREVLEALERPGEDESPPVLDSPALVFVGHSTGGIVARYLLERNKERFRNKHIGLALMASPSLGSVWANVGGLAAHYYNNRLGLQLRWQGESLEDLHGRFRDLVDRRELPGLFGMEACEHKMILRESIPKWIRWLLPNRMKVVSTLSAGQYFGEVKILRDTDHFSAVKPDQSGHPAHEFLVDFMLKFRKASAGSSQAGPSGSSHARMSGAGSGADTSGAAPSALSGAGALGVGSATQLTQIFIGGAVTQPELGPAESPIAHVAFRTALGLGQTAYTAMVREGAPRPRLEELFEIVVDPEDVMQALFRTERGAELAPYDAEYVDARQDLPNTHETLGMVLRQNKGRLLIHGLRGIGKTREVGELARAECRAAWKILIARDEADGRLGPPTELPGGLRDARLLLVIDNLHTRIAASADYDGAPYTERLERLLDWLERRLPGQVRVLATARDEPRFRAQLALPEEGKSWLGFGLFRLPMITSDGLQQILTGLAARARVRVNAEDVTRLIANSDQKPETVFINVDIARRNGGAVTADAWLPTEGESWRNRFVTARADHPGVETICRVLRVLRDAGVPARVPYVTSVARDAGEPNAVSAVRALVGEGLLSLRQEVLTPFSTDQWAELINE